MSNDDEYVEELRVVRRKKDTYRSNSSKSNEFESDLLRSKRTKNVAGPTESRPVDEEELRRKYQSDPSPAPAPRREPTPGDQALADAIVELSALVIRDFVAPLVRQVALPAAKAKLSELAERRRIKALERAEAKARALEARVIEFEVVNDEAPASAALEVAEPSISMTKSELLLAQLQLKLAEDYAAQQRWLVEHAEVADEDLPPELEQSLTLMLEGRADELDDQEREAVAVLLNRATSTTDRTAGLPIKPRVEEL